MIIRLVTLTMLSLFASAACKNADSSNSSRSASAPGTANTAGSVANGSGSIANAGGTGPQVAAAGGTGPAVPVQPGLVPAPSTGSPGGIGTNTAGGATGYAITCANGAHLNGNYQDNASMCQALLPMASTCAEAVAFYQQHCAQTASTGGAPGIQPPAAPAPASNGTATSFNVNCANGSNYNGSYPNHQAMCSALASKVPNCPVEALAMYNQLCR